MGLYRLYIHDSNHLHLICRLNSFEFYILFQELTDKLEAEEQRGKKNEISKIVYASPSSGQVSFLIQFLIQNL